MPKTELPIGIFDSGMGGLTVLKALRARLPGEDFLYLGDTARLPYGTKGPDTVSRYAVQAAGHLVERGIKLLVVACNTASSVAMPALTREFAPLPQWRPPRACTSPRSPPRAPSTAVPTNGPSSRAAATPACIPRPVPCSWRWPKRAGCRVRW